MCKDIKNVALSIVKEEGFISSTELVGEIFSHCVNNNINCDRNTIVKTIYNLNEPEIKIVEYSRQNVKFNIDLFYYVKFNNN